MTDPLTSLQAALGPRYQVQDVIGKGGMALVYRATDLQLERAVAVKVLSPSLAPLLGEDRFLREIHLAARLQHPGIVPLYEAGGSGALRYYTMPLIEGETLRARLDRELQLPLADVLHIALEIADALRYAHAQGVVHRDIKPENILLTGERVQVADFGIARAISLAGENRLTSAGVAIGTPWYMSPEQASHDDALDGRADIYSLGCLCYEMLAGTPPFTGATPQVIVARHLADSVPSLKVARSAAPPGLVAVINSTLAKSPADRPDAATLLLKLHEVQQHPERDPARKSNHLRTLAGAVAVIAVVAAGYFLARPDPVLDRNSVVVFPFTESAPGLAGAGEAVAHLIGSALEHTEPLRWVNGLGELDQLTRSSSQGISNREARRVTRRLGARYYLEGALVSHSDSLSVVLRLHDLVLDSVHQQTASGSAAPEAVQASATLAQRAVVPLLEVLAGPSRHVALTYLENRKPAAIALWLQGERQMHSANFEQALGSYRRALRIDSTLAVAALTAAGVAVWTDEHASADSMAHLALRHSTGLPPRNLAYAEGMVDFLAGRADSAVKHFGAAIAADSRWSPAWMMLGDTYHHLITSEPNQDSLAEAAFARSVALDPGFAPALFHLAEAVLRRGDLRTGERLLRRFREASKESTLALQLEMMLTCARRGPKAVDWQEPLPQFPRRLLGVSSNFGAGAARIDCAEAAARALFESNSPEVAVEVRWAAFKWLHHLAIARGDLGAARALIDTATVTVDYAAQTLLVLDATFTGADSQAAMPMLRAFAASTDEPEIDWLWYLGLWAFRQHDPARLDSIVTRLEALSASQPPAAAVAESFVARRALLEGDTLGAISRLKALRPSGQLSELQWGLWEPLAAEQLLLARLLLATGQAEAAFTAAARMDGIQSNMYLYYLPGSLAIRMRAAEQLGRSATAELMRERLRNLGRTDLLEAGAVH